MSRLKIKDCVCRTEEETLLSELITELSQLRELLQGPNQYLLTTSLQFIYGSFILTDVYSY